jgi:DNA-binding CsgD family transcriptional regulator
MLLVAAATSVPNVGLVAAVADADPARLDPAIEEGLIEIAPDGVIRFAHPLIVSTIYQAAPATRRREVHTRLAGALTDLEEQARHRALACVGPSPTVAADLAEAARLAHQRGASDTAAELGDRALALSPPDEVVLVDLRSQAAEYHFVSGDLAGARRLLDEVVRTEAPGPRRAGALRQAAEVCFAGNQYGEAKAMLEQAWGEARDDPGELAMIECGLALATEIVGAIHEAADHGRSAVIQAERAGIGGVLAEALTMSVAMDLYAGRGLDEGRLCRALELEAPDRRTMPMARPSVGAAVCYVLAGRVEEGYSLFCAVRTRMLERGEEGNLPYIEWWAATIACHLGRPGEAERIVESLSARARILDAEIPRAFALSASALLHAYRGNVDQAICEAEQALTLMVANGFGNGAGFPLNAIGFAAASVGDWKLVDDRLSFLSQQLYLSGELGEPMVAFQSLPDHVEALIALDQADRAVPLIDWLDERGRAVGRTWAIATAARLRGSLLASHGDLDAAASEAAQAVHLYQQVPVPVEQGRGLLTLGRIERRRRRKAAARDALQAALNIFEQIGTARWADRAREELGRLGLATGGELTPAERRVAELAATGKKTRQIADELFMGAKTVEVHLTRIYAKLSVHSRTELAARVPQVTSNQDNN